MKLLNVNINGLHNKTDIMIQYINKNNFDIINIQEIKSKNDEMYLMEIENKTKGLFFLNTNWSQHGVGILVRNQLLNFAIKQIEIKDDIFKNRLVHIQIKANEIINIINIYAPSDNKSNDKFQFYNKLKDYLNNYKSETIILSGDFNYALDKKDREHELYNFE